MALDLILVMQASEPTYRIRVSIKGITPAIWRRIQVPASTSLEELHLILQRVIGWENCHLHRFDINEQEYGNPEFDEDVVDESRVTLMQLITDAGTKFTYTYDYGDSWEHELEVEEILQEAESEHPVCVAGEHNCPPEDCGGIPGYALFLTAIADPQHEDHERLLEWVGGSFDPEAFDLEQVSRDISVLSSET